MHKITINKGDALSKAALVAAFSLLQAACGGGSGDSGTGGVTAQSFTVSATAAEGGSFSPASRSVQSGQTATFTVTAVAGYSIGNVTGCNGSLSGNTYTTGAISAACSISASFDITLAAPEHLQANIGNTELNFSWDSVAGATSYNLYYDTQPNIDPVNYAANNTGEMLENVTSPYILTGLSNGTTYYAVVTGVLNSYESSASNIVSATPEAPFVAIGGLNDTGIDWCAIFDTKFVDCPILQFNFAGQDGEHGRDAQARVGVLNKIGGGAAGFDYSKIAANGKVLTLQNVAWDENGTESEGSNWSCVRDNVTGLIWEVKTNDGGLHDRDSTYTWYNANNSTNGGQPGTQNGGSCTDSSCDTHAFVQVVNQRGLCGGNDWRLPTINELLGIVHNGRQDLGTDIGYFPNTQPWLFWSSSPNSGDSNDARAVWFGGSFSGFSNNSEKQSNFHVRLVRSEQ